MKKSGNFLMWQNVCTSKAVSKWTYLTESRLANHSESNWIIQPYSTGFDLLLSSFHCVWGINSSCLSALVTTVSNCITLSNAPTFQFLRHHRPHKHPKIFLHLDWTICTLQMHMQMLFPKAQVYRIWEPGKWGRAIKLEELAAHEELVSPQVCRVSTQGQGLRHYWRCPWLIHILLVGHWFTVQISNLYISAPSVVVQWSMQCALWCSWRWNIDSPSWNTQHVLGWQMALSYCRQANGRDMFILAIGQRAFKAMHNHGMDTVTIPNKGCLDEHSPSLLAHIRLEHTMDIKQKDTFGQGRERVKKGN